MFGGQKPLPVSGSPPGGETDLWESGALSGEGPPGRPVRIQRAGGHPLGTSLPSSPTPRQGLGGMPLLGSVELASGAGSQERAWTGCRQAPG